MERTTKMKKDKAALPRKRVVLSLSATAVEEFQENCKKLNVPCSILSHAVEDYIRDMNAAISKINAGKPSSLPGIVAYMESNKVSRFRHNK